MTKTNVPPPQIKPIEKDEDNKILRFIKAERYLHWALAVPFLVCLSTALILVIYYNPSPDRPYRLLFSWTHRISGVFLAILPMLTIYLHRHELKMFCYNIKDALFWKIEDFKWLGLMGIAAVNKKISLPEQGKFNAAEKINFINLMITYPLYIATGFTVWLTDNAFGAWILHCAMAFMVIPLLGGHLFMAMINPASRVGLSGMINGLVDRHWARHHYTRWFREHFENEAEEAAS